MRQSWFSWKSWSIGATCGLGLMLVLGAEFRNGPPGPFELHVWSYHGTSMPNGSNELGHHGAYRLDTQTGEVVAIDESYAATKIVFPK